MAIAEAHAKTRTERVSRAAAIRGIPPESLPVRGGLAVINVSPFVKMLT